MRSPSVPRMPPQDPEAAIWFREQVQPHEPKLRAWLRSRFALTADIDDILQETYVRILAARQRKTVESPKAFIFAVARNLAIDRIRRNQAFPLGRLVETDVSFVLDENDGVDEDVARDKKLALLTAAIQSLPDRCRRIFTLRKVYGLSQKEIAAILAISEHTVSAQLTIGFNKCAEYVARRRGHDEWQR